MLYKDIYKSFIDRIDKFALNSNGFSKSNIFVGPHDLSVNETRDKYQENPACKPTVVYEDGAFYKFVINRGECGLSYTYVSICSCKTLKYFINFSN